MIEVSSVKLHTMIEVSLSRFIQFITVVPVEELRWNDSSQRPGPGNYRRQNLRTYRSRELPSYLSCFNASPKSFYLFRTNIRKYFLLSDVQAMLDVRSKKLLRKIALIVRNFNVRVRDHVPHLPPVPHPCLVYELGNTYSPFVCTNWPS
jgi:hypothetical protein